MSSQQKKITENDIIASEAKILLDDGTQCKKCGKVVTPDAEFFGWLCPECSEYGKKKYS